MPKIKEVKPLTAKKPKSLPAKKKKTLSVKRPSVFELQQELFKIKTELNALRDQTDELRWELSNYYL